MCSEEEFSAWGGIFFMQISFYFFVLFDHVKIAEYSKQGRMHSYPSRVRMGRGHSWVGAARLRLAGQEQTVPH